MATGNVENWGGAIADIGPIYPFVGSEFIWWIIGVVLWILWHIVQSRMEANQYEEEKRRFGGKDALNKIIAKEDPDNP